MIPAILLDIRCVRTQFMNVTVISNSSHTKPTALVPNDLPAYPIGVAAQVLGVHPRTLRLYEAAGLVQPKRRGIQRLFSNNDLRWILCIRRMIHDEGIGIAGIRRLLALAPCWEIAQCPADARAMCSAYRERSIPCWELTQRSCAKGPEQCRTCEVYLKAQEVARVPRRSRRKRVPGELATT
jgi:MerR family transcriptional regulator/heat shock protein HspR